MSWRVGKPRRFSFLVPWGKLQGSPLGLWAAGLTLTTCPLLLYTSVPVCNWKRLGQMGSEHRYPGPEGPGQWPKLGPFGAHLSRGQNARLPARDLEILPC